MADMPSHASAIVIGGGAVSWRSRERESTVIGANAAFNEIQGWEMAAGRFLPEGDLDVLSPVCVIGSVVAEELFDATPPVGEWVRIGETRCRVIGVLAQAGMTLFFDKSPFLDHLFYLQLVNS